MNSQRYWARDEHKNEWAQINGRFGHVRNLGGVFFMQGGWCVNQIAVGTININYF